MEKTTHDVSAPLERDVSQTMKEATASSADNSPEEVDYSGKAQNKTKFSDFLRIFTYSTTIDRVFLGIAVVAQIGYVYLLNSERKTQMFPVFITINSNFQRDK